ncbi:MAG: UvrD-helicase domain-containing protein [Proteobacteria bacterium]|nr:UvrD-helicase domain-containing protein [Pseudomonadota bacterium]
MSQGPADPRDPASEDAALRAEDARARELARSELVRPVVLEAGAGTGKTAVLVARVISWSVGAGWDRAARALEASGRGGAPRSDEAAVAARVLERTLAITFTERAAAEMELRVTEGLAELVGGRAPCGLRRALLVATAGSEAALARRAAALLAASDSLAVGTFHALCRALLARFPLAAGVHPAFAVDADGRRTAAVIEALLQARIPEAYGAAGDERWTALAALGLGPRQLAAALKVLVEGGVPVVALQGDDPYGPARVAEFCAQLLPPLQGLLAALHAHPVPATARVRGALQLAEDCLRLRDRVAAAPTLEALKESAEPLLSDAQRERLSRWASDEFSKSEQAWLAAGTVEVSAASARLGPLLDQLGRCDPQRLRTLIAVLGELLGELHQRLRAAGVVGFAQLLRDAHALLVEQPAVLAQIRAGLDQVLVDEFQDTDPLQVAIVERLALSASPAERPGLLVVGDAKQSIYGWRNADLAAYEDFVERVIAQRGVRCRLSLNFRSRADILAEVERAIAPVMRAERGLQPRFERLVCAAEEALARAQGEQDHRSAGEPAPAVEYWVSWELPAPSVGEGEGEGEGAGQATTAARGYELEANLLVRDLLTQRARAAAPQWGSVAVLLRTTTAQEVYLEALRRAGIPYVVERDRNFYRRREVIDAASLVRVVADPNDHVALVAWLRSPAVGVPDAALLPLWQEGLPGRVTALTAPDQAALEDLDQAITRAEAALPCGAPGIGAVAGHWATVLREALRGLAELRRALRLEPVDRFVERLRLLLGAEPLEAARFLGEQRLANLERFFRELEGQLLAGEGGLQGLLRALRSDVGARREAAEAPASEGSDGALRVMTIHKAKGLTFDTVYLLGLHARPGGGAGAQPDECAALGLRWEWRFAGAETLGFAGIRAQRERVAAAEAVRTLYVGMTRPRRRLVLAGCWPRPGERAQARLSHLDLLQARRAARPDLEALLRAAASGDPGAASCTDAAGVCWRLAGAHDAAAPVLGPVDAARAFPTAGELDEELRAGAVLRAAACRRMAQPFATVASAAAPGPAKASQQPPTPPPLDGVAAPIARAVGTVVHRALEALELDGDLSHAWSRQRARVAHYAAEVASPAELEAVLAQASALLERLAHSALLDRLRQLAGHVLGREVPVLLRPATGQTAGPAYVSGSIDLLYRDPSTGELVIVDYKTDRASDDRELAARVAHHRLQGHLYQQALMQALDLPSMPRLELWFLAADRIVAAG